MANLVRAGFDLLVPEHCGGCERPGTSWCSRCAAALADDPVELSPRVTVGVPVWSLGRYRGPHRRLILSVKEHGRRDLIPVLGTAVAACITTLARWGELPDAAHAHLIPAPTRTLSARRRGGDPVTAFATEAATRLGPRVSTTPVLVTASHTRDSAGLDARHRARNLAGAIRIRRRAGDRVANLRPGDGGAPTNILVDDVLTTGATAAESIRVLRDHGIAVQAVVVIAGA